MTKKTENTVRMPHEERTALLKQAAAPASQIKVSMDAPVSSPTIQTINEQELTSIYALLAYVAHNQNVSQDLVQMILEAEFSVDHTSKIRRLDYQRAIEFLVDLRVDEMKN